MTSSPDLIHELRASRPSAPADLRTRVRAIASEQPRQAPWASWRFPVRRGMLVAVPAAAALALASAGVLGLARSDSPQALRQTAPAVDDAATAESAAPSALAGTSVERSRQGSGQRRTARAARQRVADCRSAQLRRRIACGSGRSRPHALAGRLRRLVLGGDGRARQRFAHRPRPRRPGAGRHRRPLRARAHRLAAGHDRRSPAEPRRADASPGKRAGPDRADPCATRLRDARRPDRGSAPSPPRHPARGASRAATGHLLDAGRGQHVDDPARRGYARGIRSGGSHVAHRPHDRRGPRTFSPGKASSRSAS